MICNDEAIAWSAVAQGWRQLWGDFDRLGVALQWHDFRTERAFDWGRSFRPRSLEFCLNVGGRGAVGDRADYVPGSAGYYAVADEPLEASRQARDHHQFVTVEFSNRHLQQQLADCEADLDPQLRAAIFSEQGTLGCLSGAADAAGTTPAGGEPAGAAGFESGPEPVVSEQGARADVAFSFYA